MTAGNKNILRGNFYGLMADGRRKFLMNEWKNNIMWTFLFLLENKKTNYRLILLRVR